MARGAALAPLSRGLAGTIVRSGAAAVHGARGQMGVPGLSVSTALEIDLDGTWTAAGESVVAGSAQVALPEPSVRCLSCSALADEPRRGHAPGRHRQLCHRRGRARDGGCRLAGPNSWGRSARCGWLLVRLVGPSRTPARARRHRHRHARPHAPVHTECGRGRSRRTPLRGAGRRVALDDGAWRRAGRGHATAGRGLAHRGGRHSTWRSPRRPIAPTENSPPAGLVAAGGPAGVQDVPPLGPCWSRSAHDGWVADAFPDADLVRISDAAGVRGWIVADYPRTVAWAGESLVIVVTDGHVTFVPRVRGALSRRRPSR